MSSFPAVADDIAAPAVDGPRRGIIGHAQFLLGKVNLAMAFLSGAAIAGAALVLTYEVAGRYIGASGDWQDEMATFLLIGATFLSAGWTQARRGHVGIDALSHILPPHLERIRRRIADMAALAFCTFFAWKCVDLTWEAWSEDQTSSSSWAPPLAIPYGLMSAGMVLLCLQLVLQVLARHPRKNVGAYSV